MFWFFIGSFNLTSIKTRVVNLAEYGSRKGWRTLVHRGGRGDQSTYITEATHGDQRSINIDRHLPIANKEFLLVNTIYWNSDLYAPPLVYIPKRMSNHTSICGHMGTCTAFVKQYGDTHDSLLQTWNTKLYSSNDGATRIPVCLVPLRAFGRPIEIV